MNIFLIVATFVWASIINCAQPNTQIATDMPSSIKTESIPSSDLIKIDFLGVLDEDRPQHLKKMLNKNRAGRKQWEQTIQATATNLYEQWSTILQSKSRSEIETIVQQTFEPINHILFHCSYMDQENAYDTQKAIRQLFVDTYELSQKNMDISAMLHDATTLPDNDHQLIVDLEEITILDLVKKDKLFSSPKHRMKVVTKYYLAPIDDSYNQQHSS